MPPTDRARRLLAALALVAAATTIGQPPPPARAVGSVPDEEAQLLGSSGDTLAAMVGDADSDGVRELVRLVPWSVNPGLQAIEIVSVGGEGARSHGQQLVRRAATPDDTFAGRNPDEDNLLPMSVREPTRLLAWRLRGEERVLAASIGTADLRRPCCLTLWHVRTEAVTTRLELIQDTVSSAGWVVVADLDADRTDELVVVETPDPARPDAVGVVVLRWNGTTFDRRRGELEPGVTAGPAMRLGDSDGMAGDEVGVVMIEDADSARPLTVLRRVALEADGTVRTERTELPFGGGLLPVDTEEGGRLVLVAGGDAALLDWPAGAAATVVATSFRGGEPMGVLGRGEDARIYVQRGGALDVLDTALRSRSAVHRGVPATWFARSSWPAYAGTLPGGVDGREALVFNGRLITPPDADEPSRAPGQPVVRNIAALPGRTPVGLFGPGGAFAAIADGTALPVEREGGPLRVGAGERASSIAVAATDELFLPELDDGVLEPRLEGGIRDTERPRPVLLTSGTIRARIVAPHGSAVRVTGQGTTVRDAQVGSSGSAEVLLADGELSEGQRDTFTVRLLVATPGGHGYGMQWEVLVLRRPPRLQLEAPFAPLSFAVEVSGRTDPHAAVVLDGEPVGVAPDGTFATEVPAGLLPRMVEVRAIDRLGNVATASVSVVAVLDYRQLPWIPIIAALTVLVAVILYLRVPRPAARRTASDEGTLEEIE